MSLRFILGRAGSGKTHLCLEEIKQRLRQAPEGPPLVFLVPEQATFQLEYALAAASGLPGTMRAQVLSFRRLAWRVFSEAGGAVRPHIGELGKRMLLAGILERRRGELAVYGQAARQFGFTGVLARTLSEMKSYQVRPPQLERAADRMDEAAGTPTLKGKLRDLCLIYEEFESWLADRYVDPDDYLTLAAERLERSATVRGGEVWVDGFAGFTPQEFGVLEKLLRAAARVNVALCLDPGARRRADKKLFLVPRETQARLVRIARRAGVAIEPSVRLDQGTPPRFRNAPALAHLEREFFHRPAAGRRGAGGVRLVAAANRRAEVEGAAREIVRLCRERGWRWRDVSVVVRNLEDYHDLLRTTFADYGIPAFIDRKRPVPHHPLVELVRSALETVAADWAYDPVFRYLKTDLAPVTREEADALENYVLAHGIRGAKWRDAADWAYHRALTLEDEEVAEGDRCRLDWINRVRRRAAAELLEFERAVAKGGTVRELTAALYGLLGALGVPERLEAWSREAESDGRLEAAREHRQVYNGLIELFEQLVEVFGEAELALEEYVRILDAGLEGLQLALIPPALDQVLIGSLERSRNPNVRAAFVLGVSEGVLPARQSDTGLFSDREREALRTAGLEVAPGARRRSYEEQYLVYIALTRAAEYLWLSYPLADEEGRELTASVVVSRVRELLPELREDTVAPAPRGSAPGEDREFVSVPARTLGFLGVRFRDWRAGYPIDPVWWPVYNWFCRRDDWRVRCARVLEGLFYENRERALSPEACNRLYGGPPLVVSVTRLETFRSCPFAHFARYGLRLRERTVFRLEAPDLGRFFHAALQMLEERLRERGLDWETLGEAECRGLAEAAVAELAPRLQSEILLSSSRHRVLTGKLERVIERTARVLAHHARCGRFRPVAWELPFGPGREVPPLRYALPDGGEVALAGRIDRIDTARGAAGEYLRVVDYKAGGPVLRLDDIYYGLNLQLLVYLEAALAHAERIVGRPCLPGGAFYCRVQNPILRWETPPSAAELEQEMLKAFRMPGLVPAEPDLIRLMDEGAAGESLVIAAGFKRDGTLRRKSNVLSPEQFARLREHVAALISETGRRLCAGEVAVAPYRKGGASACTYCAYKMVCAFDPLVESDKYRQLRRLSGAELWRALGVSEA